MYARFFKRVIDFTLSLCAILVLSPVLLILMVLGAVKMKGNPFFTQLRPGKDEKIFKLIKFRSMTCETDENGNPLPDEVRLTSYGKMLRSTSLDELPELFNILAGHMSIVGPRPLLVKYLPYYTQEERKRHSVRPGLTGYAQAHGRNGVAWDKKLQMDIQYVQNITFWGDIRILIDTVLSVVKREGISSETSATMEDFVDFARNRELAATAANGEKQA